MISQVANHVANKFLNFLCVKKGSAMKPWFEEKGILPPKYLHIESKLVDYVIKRFLENSNSQAAHFTNKDEIREWALEVLYILCR